MPRRPRSSPRPPCALCLGNRAWINYSAAGTRSTPGCRRSSTGKPSHGGIKVSTVELKDAQLAEPMVRALARQAEAEREKRAKIIATDVEFQTAQVLANAAEIISTQRAALALRYMQTLLDMGSNQNSTIVFPIPIELIRPLLAAPVPMKTTVVGNGALITRLAEPPPITPLSA